VADMFILFNHLVFVTYFTCSLTSVTGALNFKQGSLEGVKFLPWIYVSSFILYLPPLLEAIVNFKKPV
jgi:hypothetical protein